MTILVLGIFLIPVLLRRGGLGGMVSELHKMMLVNWYGKSMMLMVIIEQLYQKNHHLRK